MEQIPSQAETIRLCGLAKAGDEAARALGEAKHSRTETRRLERLVRDGRDAEAALVIGHKRLVNYICTAVIRQIGITDISYEDLYQEACIGFIQSVRRYDPAKGSLSNYATWYIRDHIQANVRGSSGLGGSHAATLLVSLRRFIPLMEERLGRKPNPEELAEIYNETTLLRYQAIAQGKHKGTPLGPDALREEGIRQMKRRGVWLSAERVEAILRRQQGSISLDAPVYTDELGSGTEGDMLAGDHDTAEEATDRVAAAQVSQRISEALQVIADSHGQEVADVVACRFGLGDGTAMSITEIADALTITPARVRKLLGVGLAELRGVLGEVDT